MYARAPGGQTARSPLAVLLLQPQHDNWQCNHGIGFQQVPQLRPLLTCSTPIPTSSAGDWLRDRTDFSTPALTPRQISPML